MSTFVDQLLETGILQNHILHVLQPAYADRYQRLMSAIHRYLLPLGVSVPSEAQGATVSGGYFIWITLPAPLRARDMAQRTVAEENLMVAEGELFQVQDDPVANPPSFDDCLRLCFAWEDADKLAEGAQRLGRVIDRALTNNRQ